MSELFWTHPNGDTTTVPCIHLAQAHPGGDAATVPCLHPRVQAHSGGDSITKLGRTVTVPCIHWVAPHPNGDPITVPCIHVTQQHPGGDPGPTLPCAHPLLPVRAEFANGLLFFTSDAAIQKAAMRAVEQLRKLGINPLAPRPLNIFSRPALNGSPVQPTDPFWSHYEASTHSIQISPEHPAEETLNHELGHAILGHRCVWIASPGGSHTLTGSSDPALAMAEGWADFVALAIQHTKFGASGSYVTSATPTFFGREWENMNVSPDPTVEYCVGSCLWDLFDTNPEPAPNADTSRLSFGELFGVYSPTLQTLTQGPFIHHVDDYIQRLKLLHPNQAQRIDDVKHRNVA